jgi:adenylate cyclase
MPLEDSELSSRWSKARHDLRNPLSDILGFSELLLEEAVASGIADCVGELQAIHKAATETLEIINRGLDNQNLNLKKHTHEALTAEISHFCKAVSATVAKLLQRCPGDAHALTREDLRRIGAAANKLCELAPDRLGSLTDSNGSGTKRSKTQASQAGEQGSGETSTAESNCLTPADSRTAILPAATLPGVALHQASGSLLIVEDNEGNRALLARRLQRQGYGVSVAANGRQALEMLQVEKFELVLLDIIMPEVDGFQVLERMKADPATRHIPVIMISALDDLQSLVRCIQKGADDYLTKPFDPVLLRARIGACLEKKRLRDQEQIYLQQLQTEQERSDRLLLNILPRAIAERLKHGEETIADTFQEVTVLFADLVGFTALAAQNPHSEVVRLLNEIFSSFDQMAERQGLEKIKTIGDCYMVVGGLPTPRPDHAAAVAELALAMLERLEQLRDSRGAPIRIRIGIHSGSVIAGVIGKNKFIYDLWGDTVNTASRMESHGQPNCIQVSEETYSRLRDQYVFKERGVIEVKGKGSMTTYFLSGRLSA